MNTLDNLLDRYFEGETSAEEERRLRNLFVSGEIPAEWEVYRPLFAYWDEARELRVQATAESLSATEWTDGIPSPDTLLKEMDEEGEMPDRPAGGDSCPAAFRSAEWKSSDYADRRRGFRKEKENRWRIIGWIAGIAASVLLVLGTYRIVYPLDPCFCSDNYVVINGRCYTDIHQVRALAWEALQEVATPAGDYFPTSEETLSDREIINDQLKELSSLFNE